MALTQKERSARVTETSQASTERVRQSIITVV